MLTRRAMNGYQTCMMKAIILARRKKRVTMEMATLKLVNLGARVSQSLWVMC